MEEDYFERFLKHLKEKCTNARKCGSGRPRTSRTAANTSDVNDLSQKGAPHAHLTSWQIDRKTGIRRSSVVRIIRDDLRLQVCEKNDARRSCPKPKQIVSTVCYKTDLSWYPVSPKLAITHVNIGDSLLILSIKNCGYWSVFVEVIWKYNRGPVFNDNVEKIRKEHEATVADKTKCTSKMYETKDYYNA